MITTADKLKVGDTFRHNMVGSHWFRVTGIRDYTNNASPRLQRQGLTKVADVITERGLSYGLTVFPEDSIIIKEASQ